MIKYYCDICKKELKTSDEHFVYILPQRIPYRATCQGEYRGTFMETKDEGLSICPSCRYKIAYALEKIKNEASKEKS